MRKKKLLLLSDDLRTKTGIANISKDLILSTVHKYDWVQIGANPSNTVEDLKTIIDLSESTKKLTNVNDANVKLIPSKNYGNISLLRNVMEMEKPDGIIHFTDPHYWKWLYENEHEIRQQVPLFYYHVWDNIPDPLFNRNVFESCDWIGCISKLTYGIVKRVGSLDNNKTWQPLKDEQISYVPHGINPQIYRPLSYNEISKEIKELVEYKGKKFKFIVYYNNRNIRRKQPSEVIMAYKKFCDKLPKEKNQDCLLLMHTEAIDQSGTDLITVANTLCRDYPIRIDSRIYSKEQLNEIYNVVDCTINLAYNEGFGLTTAESLMVGKPIICTVTGGLQDQCGFNYSEKDYIEIGSLHEESKYGEEKHGSWSFPVWPKAKTLNGSPTTPYIFDDRVDNDDVANKLHKLYKMSKKKREEIGKLGRKYMLENFTTKIMSDKFIEGVDFILENFKPKEKYKIYKII